MDLHIRFDASNRDRTVFRLFVGEEVCGPALAMSTADACAFHQALKRGAEAGGHAFRSSGFVFRSPIPEAEGGPAEFFPAEPLQAAARASE